MGFEVLCAQPGIFPDEVGHGFWEMIPADAAGYGKCNLLKGGINLLNLFPGEGETV
jgi:hypothetical protein